MALLMYENYGVDTPRLDGDRCTATITTTETHRNWGTTTYGGCYCVVANAAAQYAANDGFFGTHCACRFLRSAPIGHTLVARCDALKRGRQLTEMSVQVSCDDAPSFTMQTCYANPSCIEASVRSLGDEAEVRPPLDFVLNREDGSGLDDTAAPFAAMFTSLRSSWKPFDEIQGQCACVGLYTNELFADRNGYLDMSAWAAVIDDAAGFMGWSQGDVCMTEGLSYDIFHPVRPGAFIACSATRGMQSGRLIFVEGLLWADDLVVGQFTSTYVVIQSTDVRSFIDYDRERR